jgi:hypothetical protein
LRAAVVAAPLLPVAAGSVALRAAVVAAPLLSVAAGSVPLRAAVAEVPPARVAERVPELASRLRAEAPPLWAPAAAVPP